VKSATFSSLSIRNYRLFASGMVVSNTGIWMQRIAQDWLVVSLTGSGTDLGIVTALAGIAVIGHPLFGLAFLTLLLVGYFVAEGVWKIVVSFRYKPARGWKGLLASGVLSLLLGLLIWSQWPVSGMWAVGVLVGVNLLGTGLALVTLASALGKSRVP